MFVFVSQLLFLARYLTYIYYKLIWTVEDNYNVILMCTILQMNFNILYTGLFKNPVWSVVIYT